MSESKRKIILMFADSVGIIVPVAYTASPLHTIPVQSALFILLIGIAASVIAIRLRLPVLKKDKTDGTESAYAQLALIIAGASFGAHITAFALFLFSIQVKSCPF